MAEILFITDELPYPPRNGVTIPSFHFLRDLSDKHRISLLFLQLPGNKTNNSLIEANRQFVKNLWILNMRHQQKWKSIINEFFCYVPFFASWVFESEQCIKLFSGYDCEVLWATPLGPFSQISAIEACLPERPRLHIAAISDSYTGTLRAYGNQILGTKWPLSERFWSVSKWLRSWGMAIMESRILEKADRILVQSKTDKEWIGRISRNALLKKVVILPNGVNSSLLKIPSSREKPVFGHIGHIFLPIHCRTIKWVLDDVLPRVQNLIPDVRFAILGKRGSSRLMHRIYKNNYVKYIPQVKDMKDFYQIISVLLVQNYKCLGLINRTVEAMAAGVVVIGEKGAFNGIEGFQHGVHGFVAENINDTVDCLVSVLSNKSVRESVSYAARNLIQSKFLWTDRNILANSLIENGISKLNKKCV